VNENLSKSDLPKLPDPNVTPANDPSKPVKSQDNIFKTLAYKVKALEINQSLSNKYLEEITSRYLNILKEMLTKVELEHVKLNKAIQGASKQSATMQLKFERQLEHEVDQRVSLLSANLTKELQILKEQMLQSETDRRNDIFTFGIILFIGLSAYLCLERQRTNQLVYAYNLPLEKDLEKDDPNEFHYLPKISKRKKEVKKSKSFYQFKRSPLEAPM